LFSIWNGSFDPNFSNGFLRATMRADTDATEVLLLIRANFATFTTYGVAAVPSFTSPTLFKGVLPVAVISMEDVFAPDIDLDE
jgi:hypothetical protein